MPGCNGKLEDGRYVQFFDADLNARLADLNRQGDLLAYRDEMLRRMNVLDKAADTRPMTNEEARAKMRNGIVRRMKVSVNGILLDGIVVDVTVSAVKGAILNVLVNFPDGRSSTFNIKQPDFFEVQQLMN